MKRISRRVLLCLCFLLVAGFIGCGGDSKSGTVPEEGIGKDKPQKGPKSPNIPAKPVGQEP